MDKVKNSKPDKRDIFLGHPVDKRYLHVLKVEANNHKRIFYSTFRSCIVSAFDSSSSFRSSSSIKFFISLRNVSGLVM